ncbi:MAG: PKD domain-containing protein [Candidatus Acidiferrales bacterium]
MSKRVRGSFTTAAIAITFATLILAGPIAAQQLANDALSVSVDAKAGTFQLAAHGGQTLFTSLAAAQVDRQWLRSTDYPRHVATESTFTDDLGSGRAITTTNSGLPDKPDLIFVIQVYDKNPYAVLQVTLRNTTGKEVTLQAFRGLELLGDALLDNLGGHASAVRVLSDSYSEDRPDLRLYDLGKAPGGMHRGVGSQLIYNRESKQSLFIGALTADRLLTYLHLQSKGEGAETKVASYSVDFTGTTEIQKEYDLRDDPPENQLGLNLPVAHGAELASERLMLQAGPHYHRQLLVYGDAIRKLHHARVSAPNPIGWWSWTAYYGAINEGETLANADWQSAHLKALGYKFFQVDEGYQYARGEYLATNATQFPSGMRALGHQVTQDGLIFGLWTSPFQVSQRAWVYEHHKDWLVHNAAGEPIHTEVLWRQKSDLLYALDTTNPAAQDYLRQTYTTLVREWGVRFIKLDFMDSSAIEGLRYRPNTTALEALRIGLQVIRDAVGDDVILDKDGSPMLTPVGLVDTGRISADTSHSFQGTKTSASGIAARFYMHRNFFLADPDAFNTTDQPFHEFKDRPATHPLAAAQASIALAAVSGGMYEIGDDMMVMGSHPELLALIENQDLLNMSKAGRASTPVDLMTYKSADEQPSIFFLRESSHQSILTVFNWTKSPCSHSLKLADLGLPAEHTFAAFDVLNQNSPVALASGAIQIENQPAESVRVIKIVDSGVPAAPPVVVATVPAAAKSGETFGVSAQTDPAGVPAIGYLWDFGDGITADSFSASHTYTAAGTFTIHLTVQGIDGLPSVQTFTVKVSGNLRAFPDLLDNRRFKDPADH